MNEGSNSIYCFEKCRLQIVAKTTFNLVLLVFYICFNYLLTSFYFLKCLSFVDDNFFYLSQDIIYSFSFFIENFYCYDNYCIVLGWNKEKIFYSLCQYIHFFIFWKSFYCHFLFVFGCISALFIYGIGMKCWFVHSIILNVELCSINVLEASLNTVSIKVIVTKCDFFSFRKSYFSTEGFFLFASPVVDIAAVGWCLRKAISNSCNLICCKRPETKLPCKEKSFSSGRTFGGWTGRFLLEKSKFHCLDRIGLK